MSENRTSTPTIDERAAFRSELAQQLRVDSVAMADSAGSGHPTSSMSAADLIAVLIDGHLRVDTGVPGSNVDDDHLIFSKGHASPLYYAALRAMGVIEAGELASYRQFGSRLEGHPTPQAPLTDVATGSLGQGLPIGVGLALAARDLDRTQSRVWVLCGDSETAEGSIWEAVQYAGWARLRNLVAIIDVNRLGQRGQTMLGHDTSAYARRFEAFGWRPVVVDGHDPTEIDTAYRTACGEDEPGDPRPTAIIARTWKGRGVREVEDRPGVHGKPLKDADAAIAELGGHRDLRVHPQRGPVSAHRPPAAVHPEPVRYELGEKVATRSAFGEAAAQLGGADPRLVVLDGEVDNSTGVASFAEQHPDRLFEMYIAEQLMVGVAVGMQVRGWHPVATSFSAFLSRAYDFTRMAAVSRANIALVGSHAGTAIGADGPSQMALEDIASIRAVHGSTVLHPSDANQAAALTEQLVDRPGVVFLRTLRGPTTVRTPADEPVRIGGSRWVTPDGAADPGPGNDGVTVIACGTTVDEAARAADELRRDGVTVRVLDCYSIKPIDGDAVAEAARDSSVLVTVEDHHPEGGLADAVRSELTGRDVLGDVRFRSLAVRNMPGSGQPAELLAEAGIDADAIVRSVRTALAEPGMRQPA